MVNIIKYLEEELSYEQDLLKLCLRCSRDMPVGTLSASSVKGHLYYSLVKGSERKYLGNAKNDTVRKLQCGHFYREMSERLKSNISEIKDFIKSYQSINPNQFRNRLKTAYREIPHECFDRLGIIDESIWKNTLLSHSSFRREGLTHISAAGFAVRSRIEASIADIYFSHDIPVKYEVPLNLPDGSIVHPDFTVLVRSENCIKLHEHVGMLQNPEYLKSFLAKLSLYIKNGYYPDDKIIFTFECPDQHVNIYRIQRKILLHMI